MSDYCPHERDSWDIAGDGCTFCEECGCGVCDECGILFEVEGYSVETGEPSYGPPCSCAWDWPERLTEYEGEQHGKAQRG